MHLSNKRVFLLGTKIMLIVTPKFNPKISINIPIKILFEVSVLGGQVMPNI